MRTVIRTLSSPPTAAAPGCRGAPTPAEAMVSLPARFGRSLLEARPQIVVDQGADRGQHQIGAALEAAQAMVAHRLMAGAFQDCLQAAIEERSPARA